MRVCTDLTVLMGGCFFFIAWVPKVPSAFNLITSGFFLKGKTKHNEEDFQSCVYVEKQGMCAPVQGRHAVNGLEAATCRHHIEAVSAVAGDVEVVFGVAVLHHHDEPCPPVGQVIASHSLAALRTHTNKLTCEFTARSNALQAL